LILEGHLLVEELLFLAVKLRLPNPQFLPSANLRFSQLANLARAILVFPNVKPCFEAECFWDAIFALHSIRNRLANRLHPDDIPTLLSRLFMGKEVPSNDLRHLANIGLLSNAIGIIEAGLLRFCCLSVWENSSRAKNGKARQLTKHRSE
jgi:hypothetical protein